MSGTKLTIGSFNLRGPYDQPPNDWAHRLPRMLKTLEELKFDIFGAQETVPEYIRDLTDQTAYQSIGHGREQDHGGEATPIFYRPDRLQALSDETFWLTETPEVFSRSWGTTCTRIGTIGLFADKADGTKFLFANLHLQHKEMYECQKNQLNVMLTRLREHYDRSLPVILTGDFNCAPNAPAAELAASVFADARRCADKVSGTKYNTYHGYSRENVDNPAKRPIDYIFVSPGIRVESFDTVDNFDADGLASSDHFPVRAVVTLPGPR